MDEHEYFVEYNYPAEQKLLSLVSTLVLGAVTAYAYFTLFLLIRGFIVGLHSDLVLILVFASLTLVLSFFVLVIANMQVDIRIYDRGIAVQFCFLWWLFVPWDDVLYLRKTGLPFSRSRLIVLRKGLTPFHRLMSWSYGHTLRPTIYLGWRMERLGECVGAIERKLGERVKQSERLQRYVQMGLQETTGYQETENSLTS